MPPRPPPPSRRLAEWLWRYRGPEQTYTQAMQTRLMQVRHKRKKIRARRADFTTTALDPDADQPIVLELRRPVQIRFPSQMPRLRLFLRRLTANPPLEAQAHPAALRLPLFYALLSFTFLALLPPRPLSIPTALGLAAAVVFYIQFFARWIGYRFR
jgi:hypothetical protein